MKSFRVILEGAAFGLAMAVLFILFFIFGGI